MKSIVKVVIVIITLFTIQAGAFYVTSRAVQMPPQLHSLLELVTGDINYRYTDTAKRLTAIKDKDLDSCFVTNYDPHWNLYKSEKETISRRKPFETVNSTTDFVKLRRKAGRVIAHMCKRVKIFWLNQQQKGLLPPPLLPGNQGQSGILPPPLPLGQLPGQSLLPPPPQLIPGTGSNKQNAGLIPPPALPKDNVIPATQNQNLAPPVISSKDAVQAPPLLVSGDSGNRPPVSNQNTAGNIETPPPLALWLQMQRENTQPPLLRGQREMVEPPKLPNNGQSRAHRNLNVDDLHAPPTKPSPNMLEPVPDFRTPPNPFRKP